MVKTLEELKKEVAELEKIEREREEYEALLARKKELERSPTRKKLVSLLKGTRDHLKEKGKKFQDDGQKLKGKDDDSFFKKPDFGDGFGTNAKKYNGIKKNN